MPTPIHFTALASLCLIFKIFSLLLWIPDRNLVLGEPDLLSLSQFTLKELTTLQIKVQLSYPSYFFTTDKCVFHGYGIFMDIPLIFYITDNRVLASTSILQILRLYCYCCIYPNPFSFPLLLL